MVLKHIEINIWKACNNKCIFCMSSKPELWDIKFVSLEKLQEKLQKYYDDGYRSVGFLWWDISIHPKMIEVVAFAKKLWFIEIQAITNGMIFDDINKTNKIVENWLTRVNFSIHSHLTNIEDYLTQIPGGLKRKLDAIDHFNELHNIKKLKSPVSINIVLNKINYKTIVESVLYFYKVKNINDIRINFVWLNDDTKENWDQLKLSYTEFLPYLKKLIYISLKYNIRVTFDTVPACIYKQIDSKNYKKLISTFLWEDKDHIVEIDWVNKNQSFNWKERKTNQLKTKFEDCKKCTYNSSCQWIRKHYAGIYWWSEIIPIIENNGK